MNFKKFCSSLIKRLMGRKGSVIEALATMLSPDDLEAIVMAAKTHGYLTEHAARVLNVSEDALIAELAHELGISYMGNVSAVDLDLIPADRSISQYRRALSIPKYGPDGLTCLVVADPYRAQGLLKQGEAIPLVLAKAASIIAAIDESERLLKQKLEQARLDKAAQLKREALEAIGAMIDEAGQYGSTRLLINFPRSGVSYSFVTAEGREGVGNVAEEMRDHISEIVIQALNGGIQHDEKVLQVKEIVKNRQYEVVLKRNAPSAVQESVQSASNIVEVEFGAERRARTNGEELKEEPDLAPQAQKVVLIVDDNQTLAGVLERFLARQGLKAVLADNGEKALKLLESGAVRPAAIVSDLHMPHMDGAEILRAVRSMPELGDIPVIMLTSDNETETEIQLLEGGADAFVAKNEDPRILCAHVKRLVARGQRRRVA